MKSLIYRFYLVILILLIYTPVKSQFLSTEVVISPQPSPYLSDWQEQTETATLIIINESMDDRFIRISTQIFRGGFSSGELFAETDVATMPVLAIPPGVSQFDASDILPYESINFFGNVEIQVARSGKIPAGNYTICIDLIDAETFEELTEPECQTINITDYQAPILLMPQNGEEVNYFAKETIVFRWTPVIPNPIDGVIYKIAVFEVMEGQEPMVAFQVNFPIMELEVENFNQLTWPADYAPPSAGMKFVWSVQAVDFLGNPLGEPDGWAEPFVFVVNEDPTEEIDGEETDGDISDSDLIGGSLGYSINITNPNAPCVGSVNTNIQTNSFVLNWQNQGIYSDFIIHVVDNPCGTIDLPPLDEPKEKINGGSSREREDIKKDINKTSERIKETEDKLVSGRRLLELTSDILWQSSNLPANPQDFETTPLNSEFDVPIAEIAEPGAAVGIQVEGIAIGESGEQFSVFSNPICIRYLPLDPVTEEPVEKIPCPEPTPADCSPSFEVLEGSPIALGMLIEDVKKFKYPRAIPIRADAIDWDDVKFNCVPSSDCNDDGSTELISVRDQISPSKISWTLNGKGSLDENPDIKKFNNLLADIEKIKERIKNLNEEINDLKDEKNRVVSRERARKTAAEQKLNPTPPQKGIDDEIDFAENKLDSIADVLEVKRTQLDSISNLSSNVQKRYFKVLDSINVIMPDSIAFYDELLKNKPSEKEIELLANVQEAKKKVEEADSLKSQGLRLATEETKLLQEEVKNAGIELRNSEEQYSQILESINTNIQMVAGLETRLYGYDKGLGSITRNFKQNKIQFDALLDSYFASYFFSDSIFYSDLKARQASLNSSVEVILNDFPKSRKQIELGKILNIGNQILNETYDSCRTLNKQNLIVPCGDANALAQNSLTDYSNALQDIINSGFYYDTTLVNEIRRLRRIISGYESSLDQAEQNVDAKAATYKTAEQNLITGIQDIEKEQKRLKDSLSARKLRLSSDEQIYKDTLQRRNIEFESNRQIFVSRRATFDSLRTLNIIVREKLIDSLSILDRDSIEKVLEISESKSDSVETNVELDTKKKEKKELEADADLNPDETAKKYDDDIADLENRLKDLENELKRLNRQKNAPIGGKKSSQGSIVYYIPPPLEEIIKDQQKFEELKEKVKEAEDELELAKLNNSLVQSKLLKELESISRNLLKYKSAVKRSEEIEKENQGLNDDIDNFDEKDDYAERISEIKNTADSSLTIASDNLAELDPDKIRTEISDLEVEVRSRFNDILNGVADLEIKLIEKDTELKKLENARNNIINKNNEIDESKNIELEKQREIERVKSDLTRERALGNDNSAAQINSMMSSVSMKLFKARRDQEQLKNDLTQLSGEYKSFVVNINRLDDDINNMLSTLAIDVVELREKIDEIFEKNRELDAELQQKDHWTKTKEFAQNLKEKSTSAEEKLKQENKDKKLKLNDKVNENNESDREIASLKNTILNNITQSVSKKDSIKKEAKDRLQKAKDDLDKTNKELRTFLLKEFNNIDLKVELEITVDDDVVDAFRKDDPIVKFKRQLSYQGRVPSFKNQKAQSVPNSSALDGACQIAVGKLKLNDIIPGNSPAIMKKEPRTIALIYKNGKPLWKEWPVIPESTGDLSKDAVLITSSASDTDEFEYLCESKNCETPPEQKRSVVDLIEYGWLVKGDLIHPKIPNNKELDMVAVWEPEDVAKDKYKETQEIKALYNAAKIAGDDVQERKNEPEIQAGVLIEIPEDILTISDTSITIKSRVVRGDHTGISNEKVKFSLRKIGGLAENYGFEGTDSTITKDTDGDGYAETTFNTGEGYAEWEIKVEWYRGDESNICESDDFKIKSPLNLKLHKVSAGIPEIAWNNAKEIFEGASAQDKLNQFAESEDEEAAGIYAVAGYWDEEGFFVNEEKIQFEVDDKKVEVEPEEVETELFGIARTAISGNGDDEIPADSKFDITAKCDDIYKDVCDPKSDKKGFNTTQQNEFKIGLEGELFTIVTDQPFSAGETLNMTGRLKMPGASELMDRIVMSELLKLDLNIQDVLTEEKEIGGESVMVAIDGEVIWEVPDGATINAGAFTFELSKLKFAANNATGLNGKFRHSTFEESILFSAELSPGGDFYGAISELPEVEISDFKLNQGTRIVFDWSGLKSEPDFDNGYKGVVISAATLELPESFSSESGERTKINAENFGVNTQGIQGKISAQGSLINAGFAGFEFELNEVELEFTASSIMPQNAGFKGVILPPKKIMDGGFDVSVGISGEIWKANVSSIDTSYINDLDMYLYLSDNTGIEWNTETKVGTMTLNGSLRHNSFGELEASNLKVNSKGELDADAVRLKTQVAYVVRGFQMNLNEIAFVKQEEQLYNLEIIGGLGVPSIGLNSLEGAMILSSGGVPSIRLDKSEIEFEAGPCKFKGGLEFSSNEFRGDFSVDVKSSNLQFGLDALLIVGTQEIDTTSYYTYWYGEILIDLGAGIPIGPVSLTQFGAGVGWNYDPPIGDIDGSPRQTDEFSFKLTGTLGRPPLVEARASIAYSAGRFGVLGRIWFVEMEDNLFGEAALVINTNQAPELEGYVRALVKLPDDDGKAARFNGKVNMVSNNGNIEIESEELRGTVMELLQAEAEVRINRREIYMMGHLYFDYLGETNNGVLDISASLNVGAQGTIQYETLVDNRSPSQYPRLASSMRFYGNWNVDVVTPLGSGSIISGTTNIELALTFDPQEVKVCGTAQIKGSILGFGVDHSMTVGHTDLCNN